MSVSSFLIIDITIATIAISVIFFLLFLYENNKRQENKKKNRTKYSKLEHQFRDLEKKARILKHVINCANNALDDDDSFRESMGKLVNTLRDIFKSEYCAIGKVSDNIVEDYAFSFDKHFDEILYLEQVKILKKTKKTDITNTTFFVCKALERKEMVTRYSAEDIKLNDNNHTEQYQKMLKSGKLFNTTIVPLRYNENSKNLGYIQFINSEKNISIKDIEFFQEGLLELIQLVIKEEKEKEKLKKNRKFISDSNFIRKLIEQKKNVDELLDSVMEYLSKEFNAAVISFRIPVLNGKEREPLFYIRRCYASSHLCNGAQIKEYYYKKRRIRRKDELGGYDKLKCCNGGDIILERSVDIDYYDEYKINLKEKVIIIPVLRDIDKNTCIRVENNPLCALSENKNCVERFEKLYGLFKLRLFEESSEKNSEVTQQEEINLIEEAKKRLSYLSGQITLIFNSIVDKSENESLKIFRRSLKSQQFLKVRDFDKQFVEVIKKSIRAKECSIYRYRKNNDFSEQIILSATTSKYVLCKNQKSETDKMINELNYPLTDEKSIVVRVFKEKKSTYLFNMESALKNESFIELINDTNTSSQNESTFLIPIIKKDEEATCLGVVVLFGKQKESETISDCYWEQDKGIIEFIVDMFTRISEADNERLTFLGQLGHELLSPVTKLVQENDFLLNKATVRNEPLNKSEVISQIKSNVNHGLLFKHIITDIEHIYSSSFKDIEYNIELQSNPHNILFETIELFKTEQPIKTAISNMPPLHWDKYKIKQVFINILRNAIRYSYKAQQIEIYYKPPEDDDNDTNQHEIKFVNYGIGILKEDEETIFKLYKRGKNASEKRASGSGMGLYIVKEIMEAHRGDCIIRRRCDPTEISLIFPNIKNI